MTEDNQFLRTEEDLKFRKEREEAYKRLRPLNEAAYNRYTKKAKENDDPFGDLLGDNDFEDEGPKIKVKSTNVKDMLRATKACYQKLSSISRETKEATLQAILCVKLNNFLEDAVNSIMNCKFQLYDIPAVVEVISTLHQLYKEFLPLIFPRIMSQVTNKSLNLAQRRNYLCLVADLLIVRVLMKPDPILKPFDLMVRLDTSATDRKFENFKLMWDIMKYAGGDLMGITRGQETVIDAVFPRDPPGTELLRKEIVKYYKAIMEEINKKCEEGRANYEKAYELIIKLGSINSGPMQAGRQNRKDYDELLSKAHCIAFITKKEAPNPWVENEEMTEISTIDGPIKVPKRLVPETKEGAPAMPTQSTDSFYDTLADMSIKLEEPLGFDIAKLKTEVDRAKESARIDQLSRHYALIDKEENRPILIKAFSTIGKNKLDQAKYYARFVANVSQINKEIGEQIVNNLKDEYIRFVCKEESSSVASKLHVARYIAELAHFRIGIEAFFECVSKTLENFRPKSVEMLCTLINISGKFFDGLCDQTHTNIQNVIKEMKNKIPEIATQQYAIMLVQQTINSINPPEDAEPIYYTNAYNEYQAFITYIFHTQIELENFPTKARRLMEKLLQQEEKTQVSMKFITNLTLDLGNFSGAQLPNLAKFVSEFSKVEPGFGIHIADIACERVRRFIECPNPNFKQRAIIEARFIAELAAPDVKVINVETVIQFANFILSFNVPPLNIIRMERKGKLLCQNTNRDFSRVFIVTKMIETLIPCFKNYRDRSYRESFKDLMIHLQIYLISRFPITHDVAFRISETFDILNFECSQLMNDIPRIETRKDAANFQSDLRRLQTDYTFPQLKEVTTTTRRRLILTEEDVSDEEEDNSDELYEEKFIREMEEFTEFLDKEQKATVTKREKIKIPIELMSESISMAEPKINSVTGPIGEFEVYCSRGGTVKFDAKH